MPAPRTLRAGRVGRPHGLDGSFHVLDPRPELLEVGRSLSLPGDRARTVARRAGTDARPILALEGVEDRDGAAALAGRELAAVAEVDALDIDEWWAQDLEGCEVHDGPRPVGVVRRLLALPSCEVLEVARAGDGDLLVPLVGDAVRVVDVEERRIDVDLAFLDAA
jgi:16S rRNA processing protein RimM